MQQRCPSCGRAWVPGEVRCPFCGAALGAPAPPGMPATPAPAFQLQWVDRRGMSQSRPIPPQGLRLGRDPRNDVVLDDPQVSRQHALLFLQGGQCYIQDLGSANGTWVNEQRIVGPQPLRVGDRLRLGETSLVLAAAPAAVPVAAPAAMPAAPPVGFPYPAPPAVRPAGLPAVPAPRAAAQPVSLTPGRILAFVGALDVLVMFFLPWFQAPNLSIGIGAFDILRALAYAEDLGLFGGTSYPWYLWFLLLAPLTGFLSLVLTVASLFLERRQQASLFYPQIALAVLVIGGQIALLIAIQVELSRAGPPSTLNVTSFLGFAYWLSLVGAVLIVVGSILEIVQLRRSPLRV